MGDTRTLEKSVKYDFSYDIVKELPDDAIKLHALSDGFAYQSFKTGRVYVVSSYGNIYLVRLTKTQRFTSLTVK